jgi:crotonobetainyl-CoA:carnitine CoA-transferase CaiB-like acyl-CoA transferase
MGETMSGPLAGVRVLELGRVFAAPWCGQMLGDLGAEVIKVEALDGDPMRQMGTGIIRDAEGRETPDRSVFAAVNRNKKSVTVDLGSEAGCDIVRRLAATCEVFIENFKVGDLARRGLDYAAIRAVNPGIVYLSLTGYGQTGPYAPRPGMDNIVQGLSGYVSMTGEADGPPQASPVSIMDFSAGMHAAIGIISALYGRKVNGAPGQYIDLSLLDSGLALVGYKLIAALMEGSQPARGSRVRGYIPSGVFETADGWMQMTIGTDADWGRFCGVAERPDLLADPRFATRWTRTDHQEALIPLVTQLMKTRPTAGWVGGLSKAGVMAGAVLTLNQIPDDPQVQARGAIMDVTHAAGGNLRLVRNPIGFSETPIETYASPPLLGEHTDAVLGELLGMTPDAIAELRATGALGADRSAA